MLKRTDLDSEVLFCALIVPVRVHKYIRCHPYKLPPYITLVLFQLACNPPFPPSAPHPSLHDDAKPWTCTWGACVHGALYQRYTRFTTNRVSLIVPQTYVPFTYDFIKVGCSLRRMQLFITMQ